ncbi:MAG: DMT family transporter [Methanosarcinales archaeon]|nr:DMT family transporter [ANME-2 cluster archaeon]MDF1531929.1 DMT family transporter [ANME-2 cluster archaeon]MDW7776447.1 DMT family transporter [Methanosarcinales archaeon]
MIGIGEITAILAAVFWSIAAIMYKIGLRDVKAMPAILVRTTFAMVFMFLLNTLLHTSDYSMPLIAFFFLSLGGLLRLLLGGYLYFRGLEYASISRVLPLIFTFPLFTMVLSWLLLKEAIGPGVVMGTVLIVLGIVVLSREKASGSEKNPRMGMLFTLVAAICYAFSIIASRTGLYYVDPLWGAFISLPIPVVAMFVLFSLDKGPAAAFNLDKRSSAILALGGIFGMGLGSYMFFISLTNIGTAQATSLGSITPLFSSLLAVRFLGEKVTIQLLLGIIIVIAGTWLVI